MRFFTVSALCIAILGACSCGSPAPAADPNAVVLETDLANRYIRAGQPNEVVARVRVTANGAPRERSPLNLSLVIDTSGSMEGDAIADARQASLALLKMLRPEDRVSVVVFHTRTEVLVPSVLVDDMPMREFETKIGELEARGTTDLAGGLQAGVAQVVEHFQTTGINRVVLLGDGVPNDESSVRAIAQAAGERHVGITSLGLGIDYDETLMGAIAQLSGGHFHFLRNSNEMAAVFRDEITRMERVVARNAVANISVGPGVSILSVVGQPTSATTSNVSFNIGELTEGATRDFFIRCSVVGRREGSNVELLNVALDFDDAVRNAGHFKREGYLGAKSSGDEQEIESGRNTELESAAEQMQAAAITVQAIELARQGELERARAILNEAANRYPGSGSYERLSRSLPSVTPAAEGAPRAAPSDEAAEEVRSAHSSAMQTLGY